ncbi:MAG: hypothetical protein V1818_03755 [Candidatus Aenigmatarchaeota archaeon]
MKGMETWVYVTVIVVVILVIFVLFLDEIQTLITGWMGEYITPRLTLPV